MVFGKRMMTGSVLAFLWPRHRIGPSGAARGATVFEPIRRYTVAQSPTWAHPVITGKRILIKDLETLTLWSFE